MMFHWINFCLNTEDHAFYIVPKELKPIAAKAISYTFILLRNDVKLAVRFIFLLIYIFLVHLVIPSFDASDAFDYCHITTGNMNNNNAILTCILCKKYLISFTKISYILSIFECKNVLFNNVLSKMYY